MVINFFENAHKVGVSEDTCEECGSNLLEVDFSKVGSTSLFYTFFSAAANLWGVIVVTFVCLSVSLSVCNIFTLMLFFFLNWLKC